MSENKKAASGAGNTTDSMTKSSIDSVTQQGSEVKPYSEGQCTAIRMAYHASEKKAHELNDPKILSERVDTLVKQFAPYGFTREQIVAIGSGSFGGDNDPDFARPVPPMMERQAPTEWTSSETQQLRVMKEKGVANSEICKQLHKTAQQVSSKWYTLRKATGKIKAPAEMLEKPAPEPTSEPTPQVKPVVITPPTFDLTAVKQPISEHMDIFDTPQDIMRQAGAGYASVSITRQDGTKYRAEVRK
ncbi:SANT/Myb-like DNA-binding domain-containing protein [Caproicibacterium amylolyticum]|uniref:SANT/Myb domain-containing protein n=1 Tax=Caproicibacterium amylolyticum TaxID=2766537 RepID=A0A7G9WF71_9FIRM|nr:SANT/Myb-like DNA-binding domain-containing protein [Caproicibacterium amylolyticum]QNO17333.1 SANT/Myb domain-containing protein [Caproicibacterium amylolyticum]